MKSTVMRIIAALLATVMIAVCFSSCKEKEEEQPTVTKPPVVEGPSDDDNVFSFDDVTVTEYEDDSTTTTARPEPSTGSNTDRPTQGPARPTETVPTENTSLTPEDYRNLLRAAGYEYDAEQQIYYTSLNPWQRHFGFGSLYDEAAPYVGMRYTTILINVGLYNGKLWRLQFWKGQYGVLCGGEMGVYTKEPDSTSNYYACAGDSELMEMSFNYYRLVSDYNKKQPLFTRPLEKHWWQTGFKFGYCDPKQCVMEMTLNAFDTEMADLIEAALQNVRDYDGNLNGFKEYKPGVQGTDFYIRNGNTFRILWPRAGYENYGHSGSAN